MCKGDKKEAYLVQMFDDVHVEHFDPKLYIPATSSQQTSKNKHMVAI
jgi:hypothetical protein